MAQFEVRCVVEAGDRLGEGPFWAPAEAALYWFDIKGRALHRLTCATGVHERFTLPTRASAAAVRVDGSLLIATERGLATWSERAGLALTVPMSFGPGFRTNDGGVGADGAFWWSVMDDEGGRRPGAVYRTDGAGRTTRMLDGLHIPNTFAFDGARGRAYITDSLRQQIYAFELGRWPQRAIFADLSREGAFPDGGALDADGALWCGCWGGWRVARYLPDGELDRVVEVPVSQPSSCAFGGPDLATLYITSAWDGLADRAAEPLAGALFAFEPEVPGQPVPLMAEA